MEQNYPSSVEEKPNMISSPTITRMINPFSGGAMMVEQE
jgi:hypothetical protein